MHHNLKLLFTLSALSLLGYRVAGQITITQADMPSSGDTLRYSNGVFSATLPYVVSGANQIWDFSTLTPSSQDVESYKSSLQTPYAFFFFGLNKYGRKIADTLGFSTFQFTDVYNFYKKSNSAYEVEGIGLRYLGVPLPAYYTEKDKLYQFPLQYNDRDSSGFKFTINLPSLGSYSQVGYRINEAEGWGTVTTPFGTFNCLKIKSSIFSADSLNISGFPIKFNRRIVEYKWLANGQKIPVLEITGNLIGGNFAATSVRYRDIPRSNTLTSPPVAAFSANPVSADVFQPVSFQNNSSGNLLQYQWTFSPSLGLGYENGTSDTSKNPVVSFSQPGLYTVKLRAGNFFGTDEETKTNYLVINDPTSSAPQISKPEQIYRFQNMAFSAPDWLQNCHALQLISPEGKIRSANLHEHNLATPGMPLPAGIYVLRAIHGRTAWHKKILAGNFRE